jgi:PIN domain nuclease of toxin-antitoxin system
MRLLLDTHVLLWWVTGDRRLSSKSSATIADSSNDIAVSSATFWELAIKKSLGRIDVDLAELTGEIAGAGFEVLPVLVSHTIQLDALPLRHRDPFDRMLIAQSIVETRQLLSRDEGILAYADVAGLTVLRA